MPNIAIYEGGRAARMNGVSLITTDDGDGGKVEWVPQSQRQTGTLHVSQNGTYRAEDEGLHSWSKVSVRIAGAPAGLEIPTLPDPITGGEIPTGEIGDIDPVPPAGLEPFDDEDLVGADEAEEILADAGYDMSDLEEGSDNYQDAIDAISDALGTDPDKTKVIDPEKKEDVKKDQPKVEDKGQVIAGTDQDTGEPVEVTPSGKESKAVPKAIVITKLPNRLSYNDGDTIDFTGIQVKVYLSYEQSGSSIDAKPYRDERYPDGVIPFDELIFPVTIADAEDHSALIETGAGLYYFEGHGWSFTYKNETYHGRVLFQGGKMVGGKKPASGFSNAVAFVSPVGPTVVAEEYRTNEDGIIIPGGTMSRIGSGTVAVNDITFYCSSYAIMCADNKPYITPAGDSGITFRSWSELVIDLYGEGPYDGQGVPVQWKSPYDGKTYETSFTISVK